MMYDTSISLPRFTCHQWMCWVLFLLVSSVWLHDCWFIVPFLLPSTALSGIQLGYVELWLLCARSAKFFNTNKENKWFVTLKSSEIGHSTQILINSDIILYIHILYTHVSIYYSHTNNTITCSNDLSNRNYRQRTWILLSRLQFSYLCLHEIVKNFFSNT